MPSTKFLFWNINRKTLADVVAELADEHRVDVVVLAESTGTPSALLQALNTGGRSEYHFPEGHSKYVTILTRFSREYLQPVSEAGRVSIRRLSLPGRSEILMAAVHLVSKRNWSSEDQAFECEPLARKIAEEEGRVGHQRTVVFGDFNMNPFEAGLVSSAGFNAVMSRRIAARVSRTVHGRDYRFFYNPMWGHFGDAKSATAGSYHYDNAQHVNYFGNVFDQVLIRPELTEEFDADHVRILTSVSGRSLVRPDGRPDDSGFSDHLPLLFELIF